MHYRATHMASYIMVYLHTCINLNSFFKVVHPTDAEISACRHEKTNKEKILRENNNMPKQLWITITTYSM